MSLVIYKLYSKIDNELIYIGSTKQSYQRLIKHRHDYKRYLNKKYNYVSCFKLFNKYGVENVDFEIIDDQIEDKKDLLIKEKYYINKYNCVNIYNNKCNK